MCPHGKRRGRCKDCHGSGICQHGRERYSCKDCHGSGICEHEKYKQYCKECKGQRIGGTSICRHGKQKCHCEDCHGSGICQHGKYKQYCKECKGQGIGGTSICRHGQERCRCKNCNGSQICEHKRRRDRCCHCKPLGWAKTIIKRAELTATDEGYLAPNITAEKLVELRKTSTHCAACELPLDWAGASPHLHHDHETGRVIGYTHRWCNAMEGNIRTVLKNLFPQYSSPMVAQLEGRVREFEERDDEILNMNEDQGDTSWRN